ncbi:alpha/beta-hydrolase [Aspergillus steynii IBT 23096]|uniref:Alpha/beta-hydrolase n=1 Tax=Aspergillus steynii IBT 23096 TaxID=1392250 RepID=A0A2I2G163_9EURO|nr:alpha/beta-hydrolase [Aspergillus steynii IBT 23096]PLB46620.1 alpha/beta-hydrolase [Aspergillus steynii IBT 23096]
MVDFISINGAQLAYRLIGPSDAPLIITLHGGRGFGDHKSDFSAFSPLSDRYRVLSFDYRGHGQSSRTKPYSFQQIVDDIEALRAHFVGPETQCIICGGSFGGFLAQQYAIQYADKVSHLILRGTAPSHHHEDKAIQVLETRLNKALGLSVAMLKEKIFGRFESDIEFQLVMLSAAPLYAEKFDPDLALQKNLETVFNAESHNDLYYAAEKYFDYRDRLHLINAQTLVIVGEYDWICPPDESALIAAEVPNATLEIVSGANHAVHLEKNDYVVGVIREFLG